MKKQNIFLISAFLITFLISCDEWLTIKPKGQAVEETLLNEQGIQALLTGAYSVVDGQNARSGRAWAASVSNWVWGSVVSDDAYKGSSFGDQSTINPLESFSSASANNYVNNRWKVLYDGISRCNDVFNFLKKAKDKISKKKQIEIEAQTKFLRGHFYFELTKTYHKVPFIDETVENPGTIPNDHVVYPEIEKDLQYAINNLPESWSGEPGRASRWAAKALLGQVYLFQKKWTEAKTLFDDIYKNGPFQLTINFDENYKAAYNNNEESIFEIQYAVNDNSVGSYNAGWGDALNFPHGDPFGTCCGFHQPSQNLVNAYRTDNNGLPEFNKLYENIPIPDNIDVNNPTITYTGNVDPRLDHTVGRPGLPYLDWGIQPRSDWIRDISNGGPYLYKKNMFLKKDKGQLSTTTGWATGVNNNNFRKIRLAHIILWRAEVYAELGDLSEALKMVNLIRTRAKNSRTVTYISGNNEMELANYKVDPYSAFLSKEFALQAIRHEMRLEFAMEGMRFFDLVRWGIVSQVMNRYLETTDRNYLKSAKFITEKHKYFPIPQEQIDLSGRVNGIPVLTQNEGY